MGHACRTVSHLGQQKGPLQTPELRVELSHESCVLADEGREPGGLPVQGTLFILTKEGGIVDELLVAIRDGEEQKIMALIDKLERAPAAPARSDLIAGKWRLKWTKQTEDANPLQKVLVRQVRMESFHLLSSYWYCGRPEQQNCAAAGRQLADHCH